MGSIRYSRDFPQGGFEMYIRNGEVCYIIHMLLKPSLLLYSSSLNSCKSLTVLVLLS